MSVFLPFTGSWVSSALFNPNFNNPSNCRSRSRTLELCCCTSSWGDVYVPPHQWQDQSKPQENDMSRETTCARSPMQSAPATSGTWGASFVRSTATGYAVAAVLPSSPPDAAQGSKSATVLPNEKDRDFESAIRHLVLEVRCNRPPYPSKK